MTEIPMEEIEVKFSRFFDVEYGGHWKPKDCKPRWKVSLLVPGVAATPTRGAEHRSMFSCFPAGRHPDPLQEPARAPAHPLPAPHPDAAEAAAAVRLLRHRAGTRVCRSTEPESAHCFPVTEASDQTVDDETQNLRVVLVVLPQSTLRFCYKIFIQRGWYPV